VFSRLIGAEFERDRLAGAGALGDAVVVNGEAVGDVGRGEGDLHQVVLLDFDAGRCEGELVAGDRDFAGLLCAECARREVDDRRG
jgi:hypothetical protein